MDDKKKKFSKLLHFLPSQIWMFMLYIMDLQAENRGVSIGGVTVITKSLLLTVYPQTNDSHFEVISLC